MKKIIGILSALPILLLVAAVTFVAGICSSDAAHQACVYGEGTQQVSDSSGTSEDSSNTSPSSSSLSGGSAIHDGLTAREAKAWYGGSAGPGDVCKPYPEGQCTWWACMRAYNIGWKGVGSYWGNGGSWAASARAAGYKTTTSKPVAGAIVSFPPGIQGADSTFGHVAIVENVSGGKILISEMNALRGAGVMNFRTMSAIGGAVYILPNDKITGTATGGSSTSGGSAAVTETKKADGRYEVNVAASDRPAQCSADGSPFDYMGTTSGTSSGTVPSGSADPNGIHASPENAKKYAREHLKDHGWNDLEFIPLENLWIRESNWQWDATNASSGAYGIPQSLPAEKMAAFGSDWKDNAYTQIDWGLDYIARRYGSPSKAWAHSQQTGWY